MIYEGDKVIYMNHQKCTVVGIIIPNTVYEIKNDKSDKVFVVSRKHIAVIR